MIVFNRFVFKIKFQQAIVGLFILFFTPHINAQSASVLLVGATIHVGNGTVIENAVVGITNGKINLVSSASGSYNKSEYSETITITGKHVYPGIIAPSSTLGLTEVDAVRSTNDYSDVGAILPNVRSAIAYNTDSKTIPTIRTNGVLLVQVTPRGGLISGTSSIMTLNGWNWEDALYKANDGIHMNWPHLQTRKFVDEDNTEIGPIEKNKEYFKQVNELKKFVSDAKSYNDSENKEEKNIRFESMKGLFNGTQTAFIHADNVKEITEAIYFAKQYGLKKMCIVGGQESYLITDLLKENNVSVIVARVHSLPQHTDDDVDLPYKLPYLLSKAGVLFCLGNEGGMEAMGTRNLPFMAGTTAAYGLTKEQALNAVTLSSAKILGVDKTLGSIEVGKDATLFISTGDALDMRTNNVEKAYIKGVSVDLNNEQKALYEKYKNKYGLK